VDLFREVCRRNLEGVVAKPKSGAYSAVSGWLKIKNPTYTHAEGRHNLFESLKAKGLRRRLPPVPKKPPQRAVPLPNAVGKLRSGIRSKRQTLP
jgi:hypothetical protein